VVIPRHLVVGPAAACARIGERAKVNPYATLGLSPDAGLDDAETAYHRLIRVHHPDLHQGAGAAQIAAAEQRTRECNEAIDAIRAGWREPAPAAPPPGPASSASQTTGPTGPSGASGPIGPDWPGWPGWSGADPHGWADPRGWAGGPGVGAPGWQDPMPHARTSCPLCGAPFGRLEDLVQHARLAHQVHLDPRPRRARRRRSFLPRVSLWFLIPVNMLAALIVATVTMGLGWPELSYGFFGLAMAPTLMRLINSLDGPR
jgi:hypothetical protein